jgi:hypothetical protein
VGGPEHHIEGVSLHHSVNHGRFLLRLVDELALVGWTDVQFPAVARYACIAIVGISIGQFSYGYFLQFYLHIAGCLIFFVGC